MKDNETSPKRVGIRGYIALLFAIIFFSGLTVSKPILDISPPKIHGLLKVFDFNTLNGSFGKLASVHKNGQEAKSGGHGGNPTFRGEGGKGARDGFLFALSLIPTVLFAMGVVAVLDYYGALEAIRIMFSSILKPLLGIPGISGLALIASLQTTDAGAAMTRELYNSGKLTRKERDIFAMFQFSAGATITNFLSSGAALLALTAAGGEKVPVTIGLCFVVMFFFKFFGANVMRYFLKVFDRRSDSYINKEGN